MLMQLFDDNKLSFAKFFHLLMLFINIVYIVRAFVIFLCSVPAYLQISFLVCPNQGLPALWVKLTCKDLDQKVYYKVCIDSTQAKLIKLHTSCCSRGPLHLQQVLWAPQSLIKVLPEGPSTHFPNTFIFCLQRHLLRQLPLALQPCPSQLLA